MTVVQSRRSRGSRFFCVAKRQPPYTMSPPITTSSMMPQAIDFCYNPSQEGPGGARWPQLFHRFSSQLTRRKERERNIDNQPGDISGSRDRMKGVRAVPYAALCGTKKIMDLLFQGVLLILLLGRCIAGLLIEFSIPLIRGGRRWNFLLRSHRPGIQQSSVKLQQQAKKYCDTRTGNDLVVAGVFHSVPAEWPTNLWRKRPCGHARMAYCESSAMRPSVAQVRKDNKFQPALLPLSHRRRRGLTACVPRGECRSNAWASRWLDGPCRHPCRRTRWRGAACAGDARSKIWTSQPKGIVQSVQSPPLRGLRNPHHQYPGPATTAAGSTANHNFLQRPSGVCGAGSPLPNLVDTFASGKGSLDVAISPPHNDACAAHPPRLATESTSESPNLHAPVESTRHGSQVIAGAVTDVDHHQQPDQTPPLRRVTTICCGNEQSEQSSLRRKNDDDDDGPPLALETSVAAATAGCNFTKVASLSGLKRSPMRSKVTELPGGITTDKWPLPGMNALYELPSSAGILRRDSLDAMSISAALQQLPNRHVSFAPLSSSQVLGSASLSKVIARHRNGDMTSGPLSVCSEQSSLFTAGGTPLSSKEIMSRVWRPMGQAAQDVFVSAWNRFEEDDLQSDVSTPPFE